MPGTMTNRELRDAIERTPRHSEDWNQLVSVACRRAVYSRPGTFPMSWLPRGVSWLEYTDHSHDGNQRA
jgi:hypothetical protein